MSTNNQNSTQTPSKNLVYRLLAALIALACVVTFFLPVKYLTSAPFALEEKALYSVLGSLLQSDVKMFGVLPSFLASSPIGWIATASLYFLFLTLAVAFVVSIVSIFMPKQSALLTRTATFIFTWGMAIYALSILVITSYLWKSIPITFENKTMVLAIAGAILYFILMYAKLGHAALGNAIQFVFALIATALVLLAITHQGELVSNTGTLYKALMFIACLVSLVALFLSSLTAMTVKGVYATLCGVVVQGAAALFMIAVECLEPANNSTLVLFAAISAALCFIQMAVIGIQLAIYNKKDTTAAPELFAESFTKAQTVEAVPYDGGPVAGVAVAEELNKPEELADATVAEVDEIYGKIFDPFLETLTAQEKKDFIDLYILRSRGAMPQIPEYQVGGDNKAFFNKVFIYLGQYRNRIPGGLLAKIYDYSMKI